MRHVLRGLLLAVMLSPALLFGYQPKLIAASGAADDSNELIYLERRICYHTVHPMVPLHWNSESEEFHENEVYSDLLAAIEGIEQITTAVQEEIRRALIGQRYTDYMQVAYAIENGRMNPFRSGCYVKCPLGCFPQFTYFGITYENVCIRRICKEGVPPSGEFCDPDRGRDVYMHYTMFWCEDVSIRSLICGEGAHCAQHPDGDFFCEGDEIEDTADTGLNGIEYVVIAPENPGSSFIVAAYRNGRLLEESPISSLSAQEHLERFGPVNAEDACLYAIAAGLVADPSLASSPHDGERRNEAGIWPGWTADWGSSCDSTLIGAW